MKWFASILPAIVLGSWLAPAMGQGLDSNLPSIANVPATPEPGKSFAATWGPEIVNAACGWGVGRAVGSVAGGESRVAVEVVSSIVGMIVCHYSTSGINAIFLPSRNHDDTITKNTQALDAGDPFATLKRQEAARKLFVGAPAAISMPGDTQLTFHPIPWPDTTTLVLPGSRVERFPTPQETTLGRLLEEENASDPTSHPISIGKLLRDAERPVALPGIAQPTQ